MATSNGHYVNFEERTKLIRQKWVTEKKYNPMAVPRIMKVVLNCGFGSEISNNPKVQQNVELMLSSISAQKPVITKARKAIAGFKIKKNQPVGAMVTLRGKKMYSFLDRLLVSALPRVRDFRGLPKNSFDAQGNYTFGIKDCTVFPEVPADKLDKFRGFDVTVQLRSRSSKDSFEYLKDLGFPFRK